jgi:hypothetical protein
MERCHFEPTLRAGSRNLSRQGGQPAPPDPMCHFNQAPQARVETFQAHFNPVFEARLTDRPRFLDTSRRRWRLTGSK